MTEKEMTVETVNTDPIRRTDDQQDDGHGKITSIGAIHLVNIPEFG